MLQEVRQNEVIFIVLVREFCTWKQCALRSSTF